MTLSIVLIVALLSAACANHLVPAPGAQLVEGRGTGALASADNVTVVARAGAWRGSPADLEFEVTPLLVTIDNRSARPLRVRYEQFRLAAPDGASFAALAPYDIDGHVTERVDTFAYASPYAAYPPYFAWPYVPDPFWRADPFWRLAPFGWSTWPQYRTIQLPTGDMVGQALPESVVEPQARTTGFVYFQRATRRRSPLAFTMELVDGRTGERFGNVTIPFVVE